jgi:hypothetical protein
MPIIDFVDDKRLVARQSERLGVLWRSQGQEFLDEQAAVLQDDIERLREAYLANAAEVEAPPAPPRQRRWPLAPKVIDLREPEPVPDGFVCTTHGHGDVVATSRCVHCGAVFCSRCVVRLLATQGRPICKECALVAAGVHHKRSRPLTVPGRVSR